MLCHHVVAELEGAAHCLKAVLDPLVGNLGQDVVRLLLLLLLIFGIADHDLDHRWLQLRQSPNTRAELL